MSFQELDKRGSPESPSFLRFYIAGSFGEKEKIRTLMDKVESAGCEITADWTTHRPIKPYKENFELAGEYASEDIKGARGCDIFVLIPEESGGSTQFAELGAAITSETVQRVFVVGPHNTRSLAFFHPKVERVDSFEEVIEHVSLSSESF